MSDWVDLHHHSGFSLLDGYGSVDDHFARAKELGHPAVAFTEHGTARGFMAMDAAAQKHGLKAIFGVEFYVTRDHRLQGLTVEQRASVTAGLKGRDATAAARVLEKSLGITERRHLVAIAETDEGVRNLLRMNNTANTVGFHYKPRIDLELLREHSEGIWASSACLGGVLAKSFLEGDFDRLVEDALELDEILDGRFSLELQPHPIGKQVEWNQIALKLHRELEIPIIVTNDSHYIHPDDDVVHDAMLALGTGRLIDDPDRMRYAAKSFALKSEEELLEAFARNHPAIPRAKVVEGMERAAMIADRCDGGLYKPKTVLLPSLPIEEPTVEDELRELCLEGWDWREIDRRADEGDHDRRAYLARLGHELKVIAELEFTRYFLIIREMLSWAREQGITIGPGRGSSAGSLVCYLLGITSLDPIEHGLLFERFLTPGRTDYPDVDCDVEKHRRAEVFAHLRDLYGEENVAQIGTISRMRGRSALRDVARVYAVPGAEVEKVVSSIVGSVIRDGEDDSIAEALASTPALQEFAKRRPDVMTSTLALEGHIRHVGIHPAGVICSPVPLAELVPLERRKSKGEAKDVIGYDMRECEGMGLIKIDLLGLKTLSIVADALRMIEARTGERIDLEALSYDDPAIFERFTARDFSGVFQFDSPSARDASKGVTFTGFGDVVALNAVNRPGPADSGLADDWRARRASGVPKKTHPIVDAICADSLGVVIYQEHVIRILQELAGFTPAEAGRLRKAIAKSKGVGALEAERPAFVDGAVAAGMPRVDADALWTQIESFGRYGFNKSHAAAYSAISYWCMWLKHYHPVEMFCALLANETDAGKAGRYVREAARRGISIDPPNVNASATAWTVRGGHLLAGLESIKGIGANACAELLRCAPFSSMADLMARVNRRVVNRGVVIRLAKAGALREFVPNPRWLCDEIERLNKRVNKSKGWMKLCDDEVEASSSEPGWNDEDAWALAIEVGVHGRGEHPLGVLATIDDELLRKDFGELGAPLDGDLVRGIVTTRKVGTSRGGRWASLELEDEKGKKLRLRLDDESYRANRHVVDLGVGAIVAARVKVRNGRARVSRLFDLLGLRARWLGGEDLLLEELELTREFHPATEHRGGRSPAPSWADAGKPTVCLVVGAKGVRTRTTGRMMGFAHLDAGDGRAREVVIFSDLWDELGGLRVGDLVEATLSIDSKRGGHVARKMGVL